MTSRLGRHLYKLVSPITSSLNARGVRSQRRYVHHYSGISRDNELIAPLATGDVIAVSKLIYRLIQEIRDCGNTSPEFRALVKHLEVIQDALGTLEQVQPAPHEVQQLEAIKKLIPEYKMYLVKFLTKIKEFEPQLGAARLNQYPGHVIISRVKWTVHYSKAAKELNVQLTGFVAALILLLSTQTR